MIVFAVIIAAMKFLIASDIHGSAEAAGKIAELYRNGSYDKLLLLGDLLYHGPRNDLPSGYDPKRTIAILSELRNEIIAVRGNCDRFYEYGNIPFPPVSLTMESYGHRITVTHGDRLWLDDFQLNSGDIFISGHTHRSMLEKNGGIIFLNPGSPARPRDGVKSFAILDEKGVFLLTFPKARVFKELLF